MTTIFFEVVWLFLVLPTFDTAHRGFFRLLQVEPAPKIRFIDWYADFFRVLQQRQAFDPPIVVVMARKGLLYASLVLSLFCFYMLADEGYSPYLVLTFMFCLGLIRLLFGFTFEKHFIGLTTLEEVALRQSVVLILALGCIATLFVDIDAPMSEILTLQSEPLIAVLPALGICLNPIAFVCACVAFSMYVRYWQTDEFPPSALLRKGAQHELFGLDLIAFRIVRNLDHLLFYSFAAFVFLGGPRWGGAEIHEALQVIVFTAKLGLVASCVFCVHAVLPRIDRQALRVVVLVLIPLEVASFPMSVILRTVLNSL